MSVTTSVFPNLNTFANGPEFCVLFWKLLSTCETQKRVTLEDRYPDICRLLQRQKGNLCNQERMKETAT